MDKKKKRAVFVIAMGTLASIWDNIAAAALGGLVVDLIYHSLGATVDALLLLSFFVLTALSVAIKYSVKK